MTTGLGKIGSVAGKALGGIAKVATGAMVAGAAATTALVTSAVQGYAEYEQLVGGVDTLFKDSSQKVQEYADNAYKTAGLSANAYMETVTSFSASLLQSLDGDTDAAADKANQAIVDMSDNANKLGTDIASIQNAYQGFARDNYMMLDNLHLGYSGTRKEMQRLLDDATKISGVEYDISNYADIVDAIHVVQTEIGITGTTAKEASTTIEGSTNAMKAAWSNLVVGIADDNADMSTLMDNFADSVGTVIENIAPKVQESLISLSGLIEYLAPLLMEEIGGVVASILPGLLESGANMVSTILTGIEQNLPQIKQGAVQIVTSLASSFIKMLPQLLSIGLQIITQLAVGIAQALPTLITDLIQALTDTFLMLGDYAWDFTEACTAIMQALIDALSGDGGMALLEALFTMIESVVSALIAMMPDIINIILEAVPLFIQQLIAMLPVFLEGIIQLVTGIIAALPTIITMLVEAIPTLITGIINGLLTAIPMIVEAGITLFLALVEALPTIITSIVEALPSLIEGIINGLAEMQPMLIEAGMQLFLALIDALPTIITTIVACLPDIILAIIDGLAACIPQMIDCGVKLFLAIIQNMPRIIVELCKAVPQIISSLIEAFNRLQSKFIEVGKNIVEGLWNGIKNSWSDLVSWVKDAAGDILSAVKGVLGIASPSKKFRYFGEMCVAGFNEGISDLFGTDTLTRSINASLGTMTANISGGTLAGNSSSNYNQVINVNQPISTPDELARAIRVESRYGLMRGVALG